MGYAVKGAITLLITLSTLVFMMGGTASAQDERDLGAELEAIRSMLREQQERIEQQQAEIERLRGLVHASDPRPDEPSIAEVRTTVQEALTEGGFTPVYDHGFILRSPDDNFRLNIGGWLQPRYEYTDRSGDADNLSSFFMRRVRLDLRGNVFTPDLTFRVMSEFARTANLRDGWINYEFDPKLQTRFGQYTVPFQWHRYVGPRRQHFAERSLVSETFGFPQGRDIGVGLHGANPAQTFAYAVGLFDGAGRNIELSDSSGNMASGRIGYALLGTVPREESDLAWSESPMLAIGAGLQGATRNQARQWDLGRSLLENRRADWATATGDVRFALRGFSIAGEGYVRRVQPDDPLVDDYSGTGWGATAGYFIMPETCELVSRYNHLRLDSDDSDTQETEWGLGLNVYHRGHDWKTRINYLNHATEELREQRILLEHHLQF
jgi:hypothetical protein